MDKERERQNKANSICVTRICKAETPIKMTRTEFHSILICVQLHTYVLAVGLRMIEIWSKHVDMKYYDELNITLI
jgi:hypothetical protein